MNDVVLIIVLFILAILAILNTKEDPRLRRLKEKYQAFIAKLPSKYDSVKKNTIISGTYRKGSPGENVNKGEEITVCLDGNDENALFHIVLHEIAHSSVKEYDHSSEFWVNYKELTDIAVREGLYTSGIDKEYCGARINDGF